MTNWLITIPEDRVGGFLCEIYRAKATGEWKRFRLPMHIKSPKDGDTIYVVYKGQVRGKMPCIGMEITDGFSCTTTGNSWTAGNYLVGKLADYKPIENGELIKGFQGIRRYKTAEA